MKTKLIWFLIATLCFSCKKSDRAFIQNTDHKQTFAILCIKNNRITKDWKNALLRRKSLEYLDSLEKVIKPLSKEEHEWVNLITSKTNYWNSIKDSLKVPFGDIYISDTTFVYLGYQGSDDGFTYKHQTVCLDITALHKVYGSAKDSVNDNRIDRIFAHEYTHLLHKEWMRQKQLKLETFKDSILWECVYEGIGMYRSMSKKWHPVNGKLSKTAKHTFNDLYPTFVNRLTTIENSEELSLEEKRNLHKNLSKAPMHKKWGALPLGVWFALEANGNDENLVHWIDKGPNAVIPLAKKYLTREEKLIFEETFKN
ncbi:MAG TPA: hypothetical protein VKN14_14845 [Flavobacteriaceae bacterium]|nr:hypothetical protein [Flavobacteriaceae bacterium]